MKYVCFFILIIFSLPFATAFADFVPAGSFHLKHSHQTSNPTNDQRSSQACLNLEPENSSDNLNFSLHRLTSENPGKTLLVIGGIQGDEPGGFNAASLLATNYHIRKGNVWVVPNLNFISIINRSRGVYGDLNRKFAEITRCDPEFKTITKIKKIIRDKQVDLVLNLHDGSGFYRDRYIDKMHNPRRWGQSIIIDREKIGFEPLGNLQTIGRQVVSRINQNLNSPEHVYHVKNTKTHLGNKEMEKTLTYFAIQNNKPAFGVEVSKSLPTHKRAYYHLQSLEAFMDLLGIEYEKNFVLSSKGVYSAINSNLQVLLYENKIFLDVADARHRLGYVPLKKNAAMAFQSSNPLIALVGFEKGFKVFYGNRRVTRLYPDYMDYDESIDGITMQIDGEEHDIKFGRMVDVDDSFLVVRRQGYRVNVIGFKKTGISNESGINICKNNIINRFSIDKKSKIYRVEVYKEKKFSGMVLVNFDTGPAKISSSSPYKIKLSQTHSNLF